MNQTQKKQQSMDMTSGSITKLLIMFAVPLVIGNLFQQLYNTVDSLVVGNFVGSHALAAVGSTTSIINMIVMFFTGTSVGAGVVISRYYGAHDDEKLHIAVETTMAVTFICGIIFTGLGIFVAPYMLKFMSTPDDVLPSASVYLKIYFSGVFGLLVYNMGSAILRAVGDTKRPLYFLCLSSVMNIGLDLLFVVGFGMAIEGVAYATIISHRSHQKHGELPPDLEGPADQQKNLPADPHGRTTDRISAVTDIIFQRVCPVLHQHLRIQLYGRMEQLLKDRPVCFPSDAEYRTGIHDLYESEPGSRESAPREKRNRCGSPAGTPHYIRQRWDPFPLCASARRSLQPGA